MEAIGDREELLNILIKRPDGLLGFEEGLFEAFTVFSREENSEFSLKLPEFPSLPDEKAEKNEASQKGEAGKNEEGKRKRGKCFSHRL